MAISYTHGISDLYVNEVPPALNGDDFALFCTSLVRRMNAYHPGLPWSEQPNDCVVVYDNASLHTAFAGMIFAENGDARIRLSPYSPDSSAIEPVFKDYKHGVRGLVFWHPLMPDRIAHVLAFSSLSLSSIQGHYREARRQVLRNLPEMTGEGMPLEGIFPSLPGQLGAP